MFVNKKGTNCANHIIDSLRTLAIIEENPSANSTTISTDLDCSVPTVKRYLRLLRDLGVVLIWHPATREWEILNYGVFDSVRYAELCIEKKRSE